MSMINYLKPDVVDGMPDSQRAVLSIPVMNNETQMPSNRMRHIVWRIGVGTAHVENFDLDDVLQSVGQALGIVMYEKYGESPKREDFNDVMGHIAEGMALAKAYAAEEDED